MLSVYKSSKVLTIVVCGLILVQCKFKSSQDRKKDQKSPKSDDINLPVSDRTSDDPIGIPGYQIQCSFLNLPFFRDSNVEASCQVTDSKGKPQAANLDITFPQNPALTISKQTNPTGINFKISALSHVEIIATFSDIELQASVVKAESNKRNFQDIIGPEKSEYKIYSECDDGFTLMITTKSTSALGYFNAFTDCRKLAARINGLEFPGLPIAQQESLNKIVTVTCNEPSLTFAVAEAFGEYSTTLEPVDLAPCNEFAAFISKLGY